MTQIRCEEIKLEEHRKTKNYETHSYVLFLSSLSMRTQYVGRDYEQRRGGGSTANHKPRKPQSLVRTVSVSLVSCPLSSRVISSYHSGEERKLKL